MELLKNNGLTKVFFRSIKDCIGENQLGVNSKYKEFEQLFLFLSTSTFVTSSAINYLIFIYHSIK